MATPHIVSTSVSAASPRALWVWDDYVTTPSLEAHGDLPCHLTLHVGGTLNHAAHAVGAWLVSAGWNLAEGSFEEACSFACEGLLAPVIPDNPGVIAWDIAIR